MTKIHLFILKDSITKKTIREYSQYITQFTVSNACRAVFKGGSPVGTRAVNSIDFHSSLSLEKNIILFAFEFRLTKILSLLFDLIALFLIHAGLSGRHGINKSRTSCNLRGMINKK